MKRTAKYPYLMVRIGTQLVRVHEDTFYNGLTSGPWRKEDKQAEVTFD